LDQAIHLPDVTHVLNTTGILSYSATTSHTTGYLQLLQELDVVAYFEIDKALQAIPQLNEPQVR
jgi:CRISPR/Cas system-associated protein Csx1